MIRRCLEVYVRCGSWIWRHLPASLKNLSIGRDFGRQLHALICCYSKRNQSHGTFFLRNRPEMELLGRLLGQKAREARVGIAVLACSKGAEVYSILWSIRTSRPDLKVTLQAVDISQEIIEFRAGGCLFPERSCGPGLLGSLRIDQRGKTAFDDLQRPRPESRWPPSSAPE